MRRFRSFNHTVRARQCRLVFLGNNRPKHNGGGMKCFSPPRSTKSVINNVDEAFDVTNSWRATNRQTTNVCLSQ